MMQQSGGRQILRRGVVALLVLLSLAAYAEHGGHRGGHWGHRGHWGRWGGWSRGYGYGYGYGDGMWHGGWTRGYGYGDGMWRSGNWFHGDHDGRFGWWWIVGPSWMMYNTPIYPYPDPMLPPAYIVDEPVQPSVTFVQPVSPPPPPASAQVWYHCRRPEGYYPYIPTCPSGWQTVPAVPPDAGR